jgi:hypothetical protein
MHQLKELLSNNSTIGKPRLGGRRAAMTFGSKRDGSIPRLNR